MITTTWAGPDFPEPTRDPAAFYCHDLPNGYQLFHHDMRRAFDDTFRGTESFRGEGEFVHSDDLKFCGEGDVSPKFPPGSLGSA